MVIQIQINNYLQKISIYKMLIKMMVNKMALNRFQNNKKLLMKIPLKKIKNHLQYHLITENSYSLKGRNITLERGVNR
jgi:hypothetical protein